MSKIGTLSIYILQRENGKKYYWQINISSLNEYPFSLCNIYTDSVPILDVYLKISRNRSGGPEGVQYTEKKELCRTLRKGSVDFQKS
jgi:hypothetical protein